MTVRVLDLSVRLPPGSDVPTFYNDLEWDDKAFRGAIEGLAETDGDGWPEMAEPTRPEAQGQ